MTTVVILAEQFGKDAMYCAFQYYEQGKEDLACEFNEEAQRWFQIARTNKPVPKAGDNWMPIGMKFVHPTRFELVEVVERNQYPYPNQRKPLAYVVAVDGSFSDYVDMKLLVRDERDFCPACGQYWDLHTVIPKDATNPQEYDCPKPDQYDKRGYDIDWKEEHYNYVHRVIFSGDEIDF
jgi:hypothetical protein